MTLAEFIIEADRMKIRFGEKAFDQEFLRILFREMCVLTPVQWMRIVDFFISTKPASRPPLIDDFRGARDHESKRVFEKTTSEALAKMNAQWGKGLNEVLGKKFKGCSSVREAMELRKLQIQLRKTEDPNYDPTRDEEFK